MRRSKLGMSDAISKPHSVLVVGLEPKPKKERKKERQSPSRVRLFATPWTVVYQALPSMGYSRLNTGMGCHFLLQGIFLTQGLNPGLPHCRQMLYHLSHQGSPPKPKSVSNQHFGTKVFANLKGKGWLVELEVGLKKFTMRE